MGGWEDCSSQLFYGLTGQNGLDGRGFRRIKKASKAAAPRKILMVNRLECRGVFSVAAFAATIVPSWFIRQPKGQNPRFPRLPKGPHLASKVLDADTSRPRAMRRCHTVLAEGDCGVLFFLFHFSKNNYRF